VCETRSHATSGANCNVKSWKEKKGEEGKMERSEGGCTVNHVCRGIVDSTSACANGGSEVKRGEKKKERPTLMKGRGIREKGRGGREGNGERSLCISPRLSVSFVGPRGKEKGAIELADIRGNKRRKER